MSNTGITNNSSTGRISNDPAYAKTASPSAPYGGAGTSQFSNNVESTTSGTAGADGMQHGGVKGLAAAIHGAGEKIRGKFNGGVDEAFHEESGVAKNRMVENQGEGEMDSGNFSKQTKVREGALPAGGPDVARQTNSDLNRE